MPEAKNPNIEGGGFSQWETGVDDVLSVLNNMETAPSELPFGLSSEFSNFFSDRYNQMSGMAAEKWEDVKAWKEREIKKPTWEGSKKAFKKEVRFGMDVLSVSTNLAWRITKGLFKFAKLMIQKKGNIGFAEGWELGGEMFSLEDKKKGK